MLDIKILEIKDMNDWNTLQKWQSCRVHGWAEIHLEICSQKHEMIKLETLSLEEGKRNMQIDRSPKRKSKVKIGRFGEIMIVRIDKENSMPGNTICEI